MRKKIRGKYRGKDVDFEIKGATLSAPPSWWVVPVDPNEPPFPVTTMEVRDATGEDSEVFSETESLITEALTELRQQVNSLDPGNIDDVSLANLENLVGTLRMSYVEGRQHRVIMDEYRAGEREEAIAGPLPEEAERNEDG